MLSYSSNPSNPIIINTSNINNFKGQILVKENNGFKWMFKFIIMPSHMNWIMVTNPVDILPTPNFYTDYSQDNSNDNFFYKISSELIVYTSTSAILRLPTKEELIYYINYTRAVRTLGIKYFEKDIINKYLSKKKNNNPNHNK